MKIALINNLYEPVARGGAERIVELQAKILRQAGHKVIVVTTRPWGMNLAKNDDGIFRIGGLAGSFYHLDKLPKPLRLLWHWLTWCDLITPWYISLRLAMTGCQVAVGHNLTGLSLWLPRYLSACNIRYIQVLHDIQYLHPSGLMMRGHENITKSPAAKAYRLLTKYWLKTADKIISPSKWLAQSFIGFGITAEKRLQVLANPIEVFVAKSKQNPRSFAFLFVGQLEPHKGILELLQAFSEVNGQAELIIIGDGSLRDKVQSIAGKDPRVKILGRIEHAMILEQMSKSSILILPSICYENFPTVIIEAFAQKLPVMGSAWGGIEELLSNDSGIQINPLDQKSFADALQNVIAMDESELKDFADRAYDKVAEFDTAIYSKTFLELIEGQSMI